MGVSGKRLGKRIGKKKASEILYLFHSIPAYKEHGFIHVEEIHLYVDGFSKDRISDFACSFLKSFLIDYTIDQCEHHNIPMQGITVKNIYDMSSSAFIPDERVKLPVNPQNSSPILFVPKRWLRFNPWINFDDYYKAYCPMDDKINPDQKPERVKVLKALLQDLWVKIRKSIDLIVVKHTLRSIFYSLLRHPSLFWVKVGGSEGNKK